MTGCFFIWKLSRQPIITGLNFPHGENIISKIGISRVGSFTSMTDMRLGLDAAGLEERNEG